MKARQGKSFPDESDMEQVGVTEDVTKVESSDKERMDVTEDDTKVESSDKERMDVTEDDTKVVSSDKEVTDDEPKAEPNDKDVVHNDIKLEPIDDLETYEKHSGQDREKTDSSSITILPSMFLFIIVVLII